MIRLLIIIAVLSVVLGPLVVKPREALAYSFPTFSISVPTFTIPTFSFPSYFDDDDTEVDVDVDVDPTSTPRPTSTATAKPTATPTARPLATPTKTPSPTLKPTSTPSPTPKPTIKPSSTPTATTVPSSNLSVRDFIMSEINKYRASKGLYAVKTDSYTCNFALVRAKEISSGFNHDGFRNRINNKSLPYPGYSMVTENIAMTSDYKRVVTMWINSSGHAENMRKDTPYVCVEKYGNYYAYEGWKP